MTDILYTLFNLARKQYPYEPTDEFERDTALRLEQALQFQFPAEYKKAVFEIEDSLRTQSHCESIHAFILGLDMGLSIAEELLPFQGDPLL